MTPSSSPSLSSSSSSPSLSSSSSPSLSSSSSLSLLPPPILLFYSSPLQYSTVRSFYLLNTTNDKSHTICQNYISVIYTEFYISPNFFLIRTKFSKSQSSSKSESLRTFYLRLDYPTLPFPFTSKLKMFYLFKLPLVI